MTTKATTFTCPTCGKQRPLHERVHADRLHRSVVARLRSDSPNWDGTLTCREDARRCRIALLRETFETQRGGVATLESSVLERMAERQIIAKNLSVESAGLGERVADRVASFGGSWTFLGLFSGVLLAWIGSNLFLLLNAFDPYPFILLNLVLSCLAAVQAPVIMMSQNRQSVKDRERAEHDYEINLKAELEVQLLHDKLDHLLLVEWQKLMEIQAIQTEMLEDLAPPSSRSAD